MRMRKFLPRFNLKTALIGFTVICIGVGYLAYNIECRREALARIKQLGGTVLYDYHISDDEQIDEEREPVSAPSWWRRILPSELQYDVAYVELTNTNASDEDVAAICALSEIQVLRLSGTKITDASSDCISRLEHLRHLDVGGTTVSDTGVESFAKLPNLTMIWLNWTDVTDRAMESLRKSRRVSSINVRYTRVTEAGIRSLIDGSGRAWQVLVQGSAAEAAVDWDFNHNLMLSK